MNQNIVGAFATAATGLFIAFVNFVLSKKVLVKAPKKYSLITVARQIIQVGFLAAVYFVGTSTGFADPIYLLVGAVIGMTLPMIYFTKKLLLVNELMANKVKENEKGDEADG